MGIGEIRADDQRGAIFLDRRVEISAADELIAEVEKSLPVFRIHRDRARQRGDGIVVSPHLRKDQREVSMVIRIVRIDGDGTLDQFDRAGLPSRLMLGDPQKKKRVGILRLLGKNLP